MIRSRNLTRLGKKAPFATLLALTAIALLTPASSPAAPRAELGAHLPGLPSELESERAGAHPAGPTPADLSRFDVMESAFCGQCHPTIYAEHNQSTHGRAFTDAEVRLATARFAHKDCIICHTPRPIFETGIGQNPKRRFYGLEEGNTCMSCHWRPDYDYSGFLGGDSCRDAFHPDVGKVEACASCHRNHGTPYQWEKSPLGKGRDRDCVDCHMAEVERPVAIGGPVRDVKSHVFPGCRSETQVRRAYRYEAEIDGNVLEVRVQNRGAGHNFPTELKQRSVESLVLVKDLEGREVARSRMVFRDPYKRPYGLKLPVNTQIPSGQTGTHRVPIGVAAGTIETKLFFKLYFPIDDYHSDLSRILESRVIPFSDITPSEEEVESDPDYVQQAPMGLAPEEGSIANFVDFVRPQIGEVDIDLPEGSEPEDIERLIEFFQFPVPEGNRMAQARLVELGEIAVPHLMNALSSWDNKTYNQAMHVLEKLGKKARPAIVAGFADDRLYVRLHSHTVARRSGWRGSDVREAISASIQSASTTALDRASLAELIGVLGLQDFGDPLVTWLADPDPDVVRAAARSLATLQRHDAVPRMEVALAELSFPETKRDVALALAYLGSPRGVPVLLDGLDHPDDLVRESFFESFFAATGLHMGYDPLAPRPQRLDGIARLRSEWAENGDASQLMPIDPEADPVAEAYAWGLVQKLGGSDYLEPSAKDLDIEEELVSMGKYAVPALVRGLKYPPGFAIKRSAICRALGRIGDVRAAPALGSTLRDPVLRVAGWAAWALEGAGDRASLPALRRYEQRLQTAIGQAALPTDFGPSDRALMQAARTRLALGDDSARNTLVGLLLSPDPFTRQYSIDALSRRYGDSRGYDPEGDPESRRSAAARWMQ